MIEDIAFLTGGQVISEEAGMKLENAKVTDLGQAKRIVIDRDDTTLVGGAGTRSSISGRITRSKARYRWQAESTTGRSSRNASPSSPEGVAVIRVGAATETEMKEKKDRVEDALNATRAAVEEGIVPGGGVAFIRP